MGDVVGALPAAPHGPVFNVGAALAPPQLYVESDKGMINQGAASSTPTLGAIMRAFKSISAISVNRMIARSGRPVWQRNYYEHIIRSEDDLAAVRQYIADNPMKWEHDKENPANIP